MLDALLDLLISFAEAVVFAFVGTAVMMVLLAVVFKLLEWLGVVCDLIRWYGLHWWAILTLAYIARDSKMARDLRCKHDLHDYCDGDPYEPMHFYTYHCDRCGKPFII